MIDVLMPGGSDRLRETAAAALEGTAHRFLSAGDDLRGKRVLFALSTDEGGMDAPTLALLRRLRLEKDAMQGSCAAVLLDGAGELYTKQLAQDVVFAGKAFDLAVARFLGGAAVFVQIREEGVDLGAVVSLAGDAEKQRLHPLHPFRQHSENRTISPCGSSLASTRYSL